MKNSNPLWFVVLRFSCFALLGSGMAVGQEKCDQAHQCTVKSIVYMDHDSWSHWCKSDAPSRYTPLITVGKGKMWCPSGSHLMVTDSICEDKKPCEFIAPPEPEPIDVPAIKKRHGIQVQIETGCDPLPDGTHGKNGNECHVSAAPRIPSPDEWACKKGSHRILLQDVDGDWHCILFPKETP